MEQTTIAAFFVDQSHMTLDKNMKKGKPSPKKMAIATELAETYLIPNLKKEKKTKIRKPKKQAKPISTFQKELQIIYHFEPNDQKLATLKAFMQELFAEEIAAQKAKISEYTEGGVLS